MKKYYNVDFQYSETVYCSNIAHAESAEDVESHYSKYAWVKVSDAQPHDVENAQRRGKPIIEIDHQEATQEAQNAAESDEPTEDTTNTESGAEAAENEKGADTMTTTETKTETRQEKTDRENWEHCKRIAEELDAIAEGSCYRCPKCGEVIRWDNDQYNDDEARYTCPECGEEFD